MYWWSSDDDEKYMNMLPPLPERVLHLPYSPEKVKKRVQALKLLQKQHAELKTKARKSEAAEIPEAGYESLYEDLYLKRFEIVNGIVDVDGITNEVPNKTAENDLAEEAVKGIPDFWLEVLKNCDWVEITEADEKVFMFLQDIRVCHISDPKGIRLEFVFECNPYFKNTLLTKTYHLQTDGNKVFTSKAIGTEIEWYFGQCPMKEMLREKPTRGSGKTKPIIRFESCESFFYYFRTCEGSKYVFRDKSSSEKCKGSYCYPGYHKDDKESDDNDSTRKKDIWFDDYAEDKEDEDDMEDDDDEDDGAESEEYYMSWEEDCEIGSKLLFDVIPNAVQWYTGDYGYDWFNDDDDRGSSEDLSSTFGDEAENTKGSGSSDAYDVNCDVDGCKIDGRSTSLSHENFLFQSELTDSNRYNGVRNWFIQQPGRDVAASDKNASSVAIRAETSKHGSFNYQPEVTHDRRCTGTVKWFNGKYGFIVPDSGGRDVFVHQTSVSAEGFPTLLPGEKIEYGIENIDGKLKAIDVMRLNSSMYASNGGVGRASSSNSYNVYNSSGRGIGSITRGGSIGGDKNRGRGRGSTSKGNSIRQ